VEYKKTRQPRDVKPLKQNQSKERGLYTALNECGGAGAVRKDSMDRRSGRDGHLCQSNGDKLLLLEFLKGGKA